MSSSGSCASCGGRAHQGPCRPQCQTCSKHHAPPCRFAVSGGAHGRSARGPNWERNHATRLAKKQKTRDLIARGGAQLQPQAQVQLPLPPLPTPPPRQQQLPPPPRPQQQQLPRPPPPQLQQLLRPLSAQQLQLLPQIPAPGQQRLVLLASALTPSERLRAELPAMRAAMALSLGPAPVLPDAPPPDTVTSWMIPVSDTMEVEDYFEEMCEDGPTEEEEAALREAYLERQNAYFAWEKAYLARQEAARVEASQRRMEAISQEKTNEEMDHEAEEARYDFFGSGDDSGADWEFSEAVYY